MKLLRWIFILLFT